MQGSSDLGGTGTADEVRKLFKILIIRQKAIIKPELEKRSETILSLIDELSERRKEGGKKKRGFPRPGA